MSKCRYNLSEDCSNKDCLNCVLDKIRAEIMQLYNEVEVVDYDHKDISRIKTAHWIIREEVLWIIDKYNSCPKRGADMREGE